MDSGYSGSTQYSVQVFPVSEFFVYCGSNHGGPKYLASRGRTGCDNSTI